MNANSSFLFIFVHLFLPTAHSFSFNIISFDPDASNIIYEGDATVSSGAIELKRVDYLCRVGRLSMLTVSPFGTLLQWHLQTSLHISHSSLILKMTVFMEMALPFSLLRSAIQYNQTRLVDFSDYSTQLPGAGSSQNHIIMVEFDSYLNRDWDPPFEHVGINSNSLSSVNHTPWDAGSNSGKLANIDLMKTLPEWVTIGFSAGTGWLLLKKWYGKNVAQNGQANGTQSFTSAYNDLERGGCPRKFSYQELFRSTNGFADDGRLGQGGSAHVYKGTLDDQRLVAVRRIFAESEGFFNNELTIISRLIHRNLVWFIGWCHDQNDLLLVFEYMPNGCLESHLHGNKPTLPWDVRYRIAMGLASALHYLHEGAEQCVLHRDVKSAKSCLTQILLPSLVILELPNSWTRDLGLKQQWSLEHLGT
ncbi:hypothetical protein CRYUN_Cryun08bG0115800 [Craigia yunnanensis]